MPRTVGLLLAFAVFLASGLALVAAAVALAGHPDRLDRSADDAAAVRRFYAAVNDSLRTGDRPALDGLVAPEVLRANAQPGDEPGADLWEGIDRLGTAFTRPEIRVEALVADSGQAMAMVAVDGDRRDLVTSLPVHGPTTSRRAVDRFRLDKGRIVAFDRQEQDRDAASARPLFDASLRHLPPSPAVVGMARVVLPSGARLAGLIGLGPELHLLESGTLAVDLAGAARRGGGAGETTVEGQVPLYPEHLLVVPAGTRSRSRTGGRCRPWCSRSPCVRPPSARPRTRGSTPRH